MPKSVKKFCSINQWLEKANPKLHAILGELCMHGALRPKGRDSGITLLNPNKVYVSAIEDAAYGDSPEKAVQMIQAIILKGTFKGIHDFISQADDITNLLGQKVKISGNKDKSVSLAFGGEITACKKKFEPRADRPNLAVWDLSTPKGKLMPLDGQPSEGKYQGQKRGGAAELKGEMEKNVHAMIRNDEEDTIAGYSKGKAIGRYASRVLSFLTWAKGNDKIDRYKRVIRPVPEDGYNYMVSRFAMDPADYVMWVAKTKGKYVSKNKNIMKEYEAKFKEFAADVAGKDYAKVQGGRVAARAKASNGNKFQINKTLDSFYDGETAVLDREADTQSVTRHGDFDRLAHAEATGGWKEASDIVKNMMGPIDTSVVGGLGAGPAEFLTGGMALVRSTYGGYVPLADVEEYGLNDPVYGGLVGEVVEDGVPATSSFNLVNAHLQMTGDRNADAEWTDAMFGGLGFVRA